MTIAGSTFRGGLALTNARVTANERHTRLAGAYGPILSGSTVYGLTCAGNSAEVSDFGAPNTFKGSQSGAGACQGPVSTDGTAGCTVPATLALTLGAPASFGPLTAGIGKDYTAQTSANLISTAGDATLSVVDPSSTATGHLVNGTFSLPQTLRASAGGPAVDVGGSTAPIVLKTWSNPVSKRPRVTIAFSQRVNANDALYTGTYSKTLRFRLSTTTP